MDLTTSPILWRNRARQQKVVEIIIWHFGRETSNGILASCSLSCCSGAFRVCMPCGGKSSTSLKRKCTKRTHLTRNLENVATD